VLPFVLRVLNRIRPREGWAPFLLTVVALLCAPAALLAANQELRAEGLLVLTGLSAIAGLRLARSRLSAKGAAALTVLLGILLAVVVAGRLLPPFSLAWTEVGRAMDWIGRRQAATGQPLPFIATAAFLWRQLTNLGVRLWGWGRAAAGGGAVQDPIAFLLLAAFLSWAMGLFATWQIYRRRSPLVGLLPSGASVTILAFFTLGMAAFYLFTFLFCTLWLLAICHLWTDRDRWEQRHTDYPDNLGTELMISVAPFLVVLLALAAIFPVIRPQELSNAFWKVAEKPWSAVERASQRLFGPIAESRYHGGTGSGGELPGLDLLRAGPEPSQEIMLYVTTNDAPPPPPEPEERRESKPAHPWRYWRSRTLDTYTGRGWINGPTERQAVAAYHPLDSEPVGLMAGPELLQQFELAAPHGTLFYAANAPLSIDQPVVAEWRAPGDLVQLGGEASRYTVLSRPPQPTTVELRARSPLTAPLPADIAARYLALPETIPQRVLDLAEEVTGDAPTRYDRAKAIETFLRNYPYTLDLPPPPADRDVVDYFLFELQKGFCGYYASAMVVMARAVGVPARVAEGYAQGTYDYENHRWTVKGKDSHAWVEVYFDGLGWIDFEPTASQPTQEWPGGENQTPIAVPPLPSRPGNWWQQVPWALVGLGGVLLALAAVVVWIWLPKPGRELAAADLVRDREARLLRWGARLGHPFHDGQTPHEYGAALADALRRRGQESRWPPVRRAGGEAPPQVERLTETFVRAQYSPQPIDEREGWQMRDLWSRLRRNLWWLWRALPFGKDG